MISLEGRNAIVTGAARGIGAACALAFARHGANLVLGDVLEEACAETAGRIRRRPGCRRGREGRREPGRGLRRSPGWACTEHFGNCDILLNNAGIIMPGSILDGALEDFDRVLSVNLRGTYMMSRLVARHMVERGVKGAIINMSSTNAVVTIPNQLAYAVSKGGVAQLTKVMAMALAPHDIRVNAIGPGSIATDMLAAVMADEQGRRTILSRTPMGRIGEPEEVASVAVFLASDYASYLTAETIYPDGGRLALNYTVPLREDG